MEGEYGDVKVSVVKEKREQILPGNLARNLARFLSQVGLSGHYYASFGEEIEAGGEVMVFRPLLAKIEEEKIVIAAITPGGKVGFLDLVMERESIADIFSRMARISIFTPSEVVDPFLGRGLLAESIEHYTLFLETIREEMHSRDNKIYVACSKFIGAIRRNLVGKDQDAENDVEMLVDFLVQQEYIKPITTLSGKMVISYQLLPKSQVLLPEAGLEISAREELPNEKELLKSIKRLYTIRRLGEEAGRLATEIDQMKGGEQDEDIESELAEANRVLALAMEAGKVLAQISRLISK